jgi:predicted RNase H-like HicB family nuclease
MKRILEIYVEQDDDVYVAYTDDPDIVTQASTIKEAIENYAILYEIENNPSFGINEFTEED